MKRFWCCRDLEGAAKEEVFLFVGEEPPIMDDDVWNSSDEETEDYKWIEEMDIEDVYGTDFMESLPDIDDGEMVEIRIKWVAEECE